MIKRTGIFKIIHKPTYVTYGVCYGQDRVDSCEDSPSPAWPARRHSNKASDWGSSCRAGALQCSAPLRGSLHWSAAPALGYYLLCAASGYLEGEPFKAFSLTPLLSPLQCQLYSVWIRLSTYTLFCYSLWVLSITEICLWDVWVAPGLQSYGNELTPLLDLKWPCK